MKNKTSDIKQKVKKISSATGEKLKKASNVAKSTATTAATTVLDQDGDGKLDQNDVKIMTEKGTKLAKTATRSAGEFVKDVVKSDLVKEAAAGAAVGAVIAVPVPLIGPGAGAVIGATLGAYKSFMKKK